MDSAEVDKELAAMGPVRDRVLKDYADRSNPLTLPPDIQLVLDRTVRLLLTAMRDNLQHVRDEEGNTLRAMELFHRTCEPGTGLLPDDAFNRLLWARFLDTRSFAQTFEDTSAAPGQRQRARALLKVRLLL